LPVLRLAVVALEDEDVAAAGGPAVAFAAALMVRVSEGTADGIAERKFTGPLDGLPALSRSAAEYVFSESEPGLWASHLTAEGRYAEAIEFARAAYGSVGAADKPYLLNSWGIALEPTGGSPRANRCYLRSRW